MVEQSSNDLNQIRDQIQDMENQNGLSNQRISELDSGDQALLEKLLGLEKRIIDRKEGLDKQMRTCLQRSTVYKLTMHRVWLISERILITS